MSSTEIRRSRVSVGRYNEKDKGTLVYSVDTKEEMYSLSASLLGSSVIFNPYFPPLKITGTKEIVNDPELPSKSKLIAYCEGASANMHQPGRAYMSVKAVPHSQEMTEDLSEEGRIIRGKKSEWVDEGRQEYAYFEPKTGDRYLIYTATTEITVHTAYPQDEIQWDTINDRIGSINSNAMPLLGGAQARELKLVAAGIPEYHLWSSGDEIIPIVYKFYKSPDNKEYPLEIEVQKYAHMVSYGAVMSGEEDNPYIATDGTVTNDLTEAKMREYVTAMPWESMYPTWDTDKRVVNIERDFSDLYGLLTW